ncbi:unnamed protein product [Protopolystoma xenopodis]|uniref:Uncharacterized protein n=1 Tax=Protopolystoma xenopodis TaxID=117903 RepID=A0A448XNK6_9PLAT|nr:unnamed protein product [Protopolystoma xenopodis]
MELKTCTDDSPGGRIHRHRMPIIAQRLSVVVLPVDLHNARLHSVGKMQPTGVLTGQRQRGWGLGSEVWWAAVRETEGQEEETIETGLRCGAAAPIMLVAVSGGRRRGKGWLTGREGVRNGGRREGKQEDRKYRLSGRLQASAMHLSGREYAIKDSKGRRGMSNLFPLSGRMESMQNLSECEMI